MKRQHVCNDGISRAEIGKCRDKTFRLSISDDSSGWAKFLSAVPEAFHHDMQGSTLFGTMTSDADDEVAAHAYRPAIHRLFDIMVCTRDTPCIDMH